ncbi:hypothetical protein IWW55_005332 [Coemansia sp. RSA 2706]|nr:hypothetical protein IWW55_005332 [Coemansia sp. RSA 2706]
MRGTVIRQAKAQYQWHKHVPLIKFIGPRKALWEQQAGGSQPVTAGGSGGGKEAMNFWELPARYRPRPISDAEIEAIESGGASLV